jgi:uncharacterized membrane protein YqjE
MREIQTTPELIHEIIGDVQEIVRSEVRLAKTEAKEEAGKAGSAAGMFGAAGVFGLFGLALFEAMAVVLWAMLMPLWIAFLVMGLISLCTAGIFFALGRDRWRKVHPLPNTVTTIKEDLEWAKNQSR